MYEVRCRKDKAMKFFAKGKDVFMDRGDGQSLKLCEVSPMMLTPSSLAEEIARAMNGMFGKEPRA